MNPTDVDSGCTIKRMYAAARSIDGLVWEELRVIMYDHGYFPERGDKILISRSTILRVFGVAPIFEPPDFVRIAPDTISGMEGMTFMYKNPFPTTTPNTKEN
jgi:hypothetical protein